jgi:hypothetical protein
MNHPHYIGDSQTTVTVVAVAVERNKLPKQQDPTPVVLYQFRSGNIGTDLICKPVQLEG